MIEAEGFLCVHSFRLRLLQQRLPHWHAKTAPLVQGLVSLHCRTVAHHTEGGPLPSCMRPCSSHTDEWCIDEVLREEPRLEFASADNIGDDEVVGAVITECSDAGRRLVRVTEDKRVRLEQPGQHRRDFLAAIWGPRHLG